MLEKIHDHITNELQQTARTDIVFVVTSVLFNLIVLGINSAVASSAVSEKSNSSDDFVLFIFIFMVIMVNTIAMVAMRTGKNTRNRLLEGLIAMYKDNDVDKYYNSTILSNYSKRNFLFTAVIVCLFITSIAVPIVIRFI